MPVICVMFPRLITSPWFGPVSRRRVERFAGRQRLVITPDNGNLVISYLGVTRRWRSLGLLIGVLLSTAWAFRDSRLSINFLAAFTGWFVGALVAEYRIASAPPGARRAASLEPRLLRRQLRSGALRLPIFMTAVSAVCGSAALVSAGTGADVDVPLVLGYLAAAVAAFGLPVIVGRHVLARPRPLGTSVDQQLADDALRDRSLQVLAGCAIALATYPAANLASQVGDSLNERLGGVPWIMGAVLLVLGPICGWLVATRARPKSPADDPSLASQPS